ncbi:MAG: transposase [Planctomycetaceae bacterium]|nr:transposase [Planctomycetaceae bacterium]
MIRIFRRLFCNSFHAVKQASQHDSQALHRRHPRRDQPEVTDRTIQQDDCPKCRKVVEPAVPDAMPDATIGHRGELFVFLYHADVPFDNNHAERTIRGAVMMRKNSYCNRSVDDAKTQAILVSVFQTLKQQNANVTKTIVNALHQFLSNRRRKTYRLFQKYFIKNYGKTS